LTRRENWQREGDGCDWGSGRSRVEGVWAILAQLVDAVGRHLQGSVGQHGVKWCAA